MVLPSWLAEMTLPDRGAFQRRTKLNASPNATVTRTVLTTRQVARDFCILLARAAAAGVLIGLAFAALVTLLAMAGA